MKRNFYFKAILFIGIITGFLSQQANAQAISGTRTVCNSGCDYPTISAAVNALNTNGVGVGGVMINIAAGHTETLTTAMVLGVTGTATNPIVFQKNGSGANPRITAFTGTRLASSTDSIDVMWAFEGSDHITIDGIDLQDNTSNTTPTTMMEVGIGFYKRSATDGASNNLIRNCVITLNRDNIIASAGVRANATGSVAIEFVNATRTNLGTAISVSTVAGSSSFNRIYSNTIQNCNFGISLIGFAAPSPYTLADANNDIGGTSASTGNTIINFGGGVSPVSACGAMFISNQWSYNISNNIINNNNGSGVNHPTSNRGVWLFSSSPGSSCDIKNNRITISGGANTGSINWCLDFEAAQGGANGNTINIDSNQFINCNVSNASTVAFTAIWLNTGATNVNVRNNYIYGFRYSGTGTTQAILSQLACVNLNISNNIIDSLILDGANATGTHHNIGVTVAPTATLNINNNITRRTILNTPGTGTKLLYSIYFIGATPINNFIGNTVDSIIRNGTTGGTTIGIFQTGGTNGTSTTTIRRNTVSNLFITGAGTTSTMTGIQASTGTIIVDSNTVFNLSCQKSTGSGTLYGIYNISSPNNERYNNNNVNNLTHLGTGTTYGIYSFSTTGVKTISYNVVHTLSTSGATIAGIATQASTPSVFNNKVYNVASAQVGSPTVSGIVVLSVTSGTGSIYNNLIGDLRAPSATTTTPTTAPTVRGINITSATATTALDISHNTVFINATSSGTTFATTALFHAGNATATTSNIILRNNIFVNTSTAVGAGRTVAYHRSSTALNNFDLSSNRNLFYAGVPSATNLIFYDGTNSDQTLSAYQTRVLPRDSASFTENVSFVSTAGANTSFLKINPTIPTFIEAGSARNVSIGFDYDNIIRAGFPGYVGTSGLPDLGAWEENLTPQPINNMYFDSLNTEQTSIVVPQGSINNLVIRIPVYTQKGSNALVATSFKLNTAGSTSAADITQARIFYTGSSTTFSTNNLFGTTNTPSGTFYVNGSQTLATGINYFWLTYNVSATATPNNLLDAQLDSITLSGTPYAPINGNPNGALTIQPRLNGVYNVGVGQAFATLTQAVNTLTQLGVSGPVTFILKDAVYDNTTGEVFPIVLGPYTNASPTNSVTIRPDVGVASSINGNSNIATIDLNNASHVYIDGRPGGAGGFVSGNNLIIRTSSATAPAVRFINDADSNQILYTDLRSSNTTALGSAGAGVINFGTTTFANGNDFNTIKFCDIREEGSGFPVAAISSIGSATTIAANNDNNIVDSCNIYNFFSPTVNSAAIYVGANNSAWQIRGNRFYQTAARSFTAAPVHRVFWITPNVANLTSASGFVINNNFIGGNNTAGTGNYEMNGNFAHSLNVFDISVGLGAATSIQGNTITNINYTTNNTSSTAFLGINMVNGNVNFGTLQGNTIGSRTTNGAITVNTSSTTSTGFIGIRTGGGTGNTFNIANNFVSGIDVYGTTATTTPEFFGINVFTGTNVNVFNNLIGDTSSLTGSIRIFSVATSGTTQQRVSGIFNNPSSGTPVHAIFNNTIANIFNFHSVTGTHITATRGVLVNPTIAGTYTVTNNLITNLYSAGRTNATGINTVIGGLVVSGTVGTFDVRQNTIRSLHLTATTTTDAIQSTGIFFSTNANATHNLIRNEVHTQMVWDNNPLAVLTGFDVAAGNNNINNNLIRMGIDTLGNAIVTGATLRGISKNSGNSNFYFNTIYIGGNNVNNSSSNTFAFQRTGAGTDDVLNNIIVNQRTNVSAGGPGHYAIQINNNTTLNSNYNLLFADTIGRVGTTTFASIANWKAGAVEDANSIYGNPGLLNPTGGINTLSLRINPANPTPIEGTGIAVAGFGTDEDFDGQTRTNLTPVDLGADAGNFIAQDLASPVINYTALTNTIATTNRTIVATITDASGVYTTGVLMPRIYFKKAASGAYQSTAGVLTSGNAANGTWTFTINNALIGGVVGDDSVYYFVVAQDSTPTSNLGSSPGGAEGTSVNNITVFPSLNAYRIQAVISGVFNVGTGQSFTSLTGANGIFSYINSSVVGGNITIQITSDLEETGLNGLNETVETGTGNYSIRIEPNAAVVRNVVGNYAVTFESMIRLNGADRVRVDGSFAGSGRFLRFMNRAAAGATFAFQQDADNDTLANCIIEGTNNTVAMINFWTSTKVGGTGNDSNAVIGCLIRDTLGNIISTAMPNTGIFSQTTFSNDFNTIDNNEFVNIGFSSINMGATAGSFWTISNNKSYQTMARNVGMVVYQIDGGTNYLITGNSIGGAAADRSGAAMTSTTGSTMIRITVGANNPVTVSNNVISNVGSTTVAFQPIVVSSGIVTLNNNTIGGGVLPYDTIATNGTSSAIHFSGGTGSSIVINNNLVSHINFFNASTLRNAGISATTTTSGPITISNNTIRNIYGLNTGIVTSSSRLGGILITSGPPSGITIEGNTVSNIQSINTGTAAYSPVGIMVSASGGYNIIRNRIRNIGAIGMGPGSSAPEVVGIHLLISSNAIVANNQISLGDSAMNESRVYGIFDATAGANTYAYNSIFITGNTNVGPNNSTGFHRSTPTSNINFRNNLVYNKRTTNGTGFGYGVSSASATGVSGANINYNTFIVNDTARIAELPAGVGNSWSALNTFYPATYNTNWAERTSVVSAQDLFIDTLNGNLGIVTSSPAAWYVNGKGIRIPNISGDFNNATGVRSTTIVSGATDIGSVEFTPTSTPPNAFADKAPAANDSTQFFFASRMVAKAVWGAGNLPTAVNVQYYSGVNPTNTISGSSFANAYYNVQPTGGSGYTFNLTLMQDSAIHRNIAAVNRMQIANYLGTATDWLRYNNSAALGNNGYVLANNVSNTGVFTFTDSALTPLPVSLNYFMAKVEADDVVLNWQTATEKNNKGFLVQRSTNGVEFKDINFVTGKGNASTVSNYTMLDVNPFDASNVLYYRLKQIDFDGAYAYSNVAVVNKNNLDLSSVSIYPNPVVSQFIVEFMSKGNTIATIQIVDMHGKTIYTQQLETNNGLNKVNVNGAEELAPGIYFARLTVNGETQTIKLIKQ